MRPRDPRYTAAIKLRYNAVLFLEHPTPLHWDAGGALFGKSELRAMYRYLNTDDGSEFPAALRHDFDVLALLYLFIAEALQAEQTK